MLKQHEAGGGTSTLPVTAMEASARRLTTVVLGFFRHERRQYSLQPHRAVPGMKEEEPAPCLMAGVGWGRDCSAIPSLPSGLGLRPHPMGWKGKVLEIA